MKWLHRISTNIINKFIWFFGDNVETYILVLLGMVFSIFAFLHHNAYSDFLIYSVVHAWSFLTILYERPTYKTKYVSQKTLTMFTNILIITAFTTWTFYRYC